MSDVDAFRHYWNGCRYVCPVTGQTVDETYTDHNRPGSFNSCKLCGDPNFSIARDLRQLNKKRKREHEGAQ